MLLLLKPLKKQQSQQVVAVEMVAVAVVSGSPEHTGKLTTKSTEKKISVDFGEDEDDKSKEEEVEVAWK